MRFATLVLALIPLTFALPGPQLVKRAPDLAPQVLGKIGELNTAVGGLNTAVNNFDGSLAGVIPQSLAVISAELKLDATTLVTTFITKQSSNFTSAESQSVVSALAGLIGPIQSSLSALSTKYPAFQKTLESPIVLLDLKVLKAHTDDLINAVTVKVTPDNAGLLGFGKGIIDQAFDGAIAVYSGS